MMKKRLLLTAVTLLCWLFLAGAACAEDWRDTATPLTVDTPAEAVIDAEGGYAYFSFTPTETGNYIWVSTAEGLDTYGYVYDADGSQLHSNDDGGEEHNFSMTITLQAGQTYYFGAHFYSTSLTGSFPVRLNSYHGLTSVYADNSNVSVKPNTSATLEVIAETTDGAITYQWYDENGTLLSGETSSTLITGALSYYTQYSCQVSDIYGHQSEVTIYVDIDNGLKAKCLGTQYFDILPQASATLAVSASCDHGALHYQWYQDYDSTLEGEISDTFNTGALTEGSSYRCVVSDDYGNTKDVFFHVYIDNQLTTDPRFQQSVFVPYNTTTTLSLEASCAVGGLTYEWLMEGEVIEGATSSSLITEPIPYRTEYRCKVYDDFGAFVEVVFDVHVENGFKAMARETEIQAQLGGTALLEIDATCNQGELNYDWHIYNTDCPTVIDGPRLELSDAWGTTDITCDVYDDFGNDAHIEFVVMVDKEYHYVAKASVNGAPAVEMIDDMISVAPGDQVVLTIEATSVYDIFLYDWTNVPDEALENNATLTLPAVDRTMHLSCEIEDGSGGIHYVYPTVIIDNQLTAAAIGSTCIEAVAGQPVTMAVEASAASGDIEYEWFLSSVEEYDDYAGDAPSITVTPERDMEHWVCVVSDAYNNYVSIEFTIVLKQPPVLTLNDTLHTEITFDEYYYYSFTPQQTGTYSLIAVGDGDASVSLWAVSGEQLPGKTYYDGYNFTFTATLTAGVKYIYQVHIRDGSDFDFTVVKGTKGAHAGDLTLRKGQTVRMPGAALASDDSAVASVSGMSLTAVNNGETLITVTGDGGQPATYTVRVVSGSTVTLPSGTKTVAAEAFSNDTALRFVTLSGQTTSVGAFAFSNSGIVQLVVPSSSTTIAFSAFYGAKPTILCREGSDAEAMARQRGLIYAYID